MAADSGDSVMEAWIAGLAFGLSVIVAVVQFSGNRPVIDIEPDERHRQPDDWTFLLRVRNGTSGAIQLRRHRFWFSSSQLIAPGGVDDVAEQWDSGTVNIWMPPSSEADLALVMEEGKWLVLILNWRRLSGLHLTSLLPLFVPMSPSRLAHLKGAQKQVLPIRG